MKVSQLTSSTLSVAYTPDSDDAFYYFALQHGLVPSCQPIRFHRKPIAQLNRLATDGRFDVSAISSVIYPLISQRYQILSVGTSVGRGYGPVLVADRSMSLGDLEGHEVAVGGVPSTGWFLLKWACPKARPIERPYETIAQSILAGELAAGVMIHEELIYYRRLGLHRLLDLGAAWCDTFQLPLPVGLNVIRRDMPTTRKQQVCAEIAASVQYGMAHRNQALKWASQFGRGAEGECTDRFVDMFANQDSLSITEDVFMGLRKLLDLVREIAHFPARRAGRADIVYPQSCHSVDSHDRTLYQGYAHAS